MYLEIFSRYSKLFSQAGSSNKRPTTIEKKKELKQFKNLCFTFLLLVKIQQVILQDEFVVISFGLEATRVTRIVRMNPDYYYL